MSKMAVALNGWMVTITRKMDKEARVSVSVTVSVLKNISVTDRSYVGFCSDHSGVVYLAGPGKLGVSARKSLH